MAKKTSYLTELIERHERWKAEGGERQEEKDNNNDVDTDLLARLPVALSSYLLPCQAGKW